MHGPDKETSKAYVNGGPELMHCVHWWLNHLQYSLVSFHWPQHCFPCSSKPHLSHYSPLSGTLIWNLCVGTWTFHRPLVQIQACYCCKTYSTDQGSINVTKIGGHLKILVPELRHKASFILSSQNHRRHRTKFGRHGDPELGISACLF